MFWQLYLLFVFTTAMIVVTPGAAALAMASQGASNGGRRAISGVVGVAAANVVYFLLSATGLASLIIASNLVFSVIKWVGVIYLVWLGLTAILSHSGPLQVKEGRKRSSVWHLFCHGFIIEISNPKALLYFSAILPQFLDLNRPLIPQLVILGGTTLVMDLASYSAYAALGHHIARGGLKGWVVRLMNKLVGGTLLYIGFRMASVVTTK